MPKTYNDALLEYLALSQLRTELTGTLDFNLRTEISYRIGAAREKIERTLKGARRPERQDF